MLVDMSYIHFTPEQWSQYRGDERLSLSAQDIERLQGHLETIDRKEISEIYLPLSRLLNLYVVQHQKLHQATSEFLHHVPGKVPFLIAVTGSVAVGKSTTSRVLQALLQRWPDHPRVELINTDGFLKTTAELEAADMMQRKGFPDSYHFEHFVATLSAIKSGIEEVTIPVYSHEIYDIVDSETRTIPAADIIIVEGLNVLQTGASRYFDFAIYVDADEEMIKQWFLERFMFFRELALSDSQAFFHKFTKLTPEQALHFATRIWDTINAVNLRENILPYRSDADLVLTKGIEHKVTELKLRRL